MFHEKEFPLGPQDPPDLTQGSERIWDHAQRPGPDGGVVKQQQSGWDPQPTRGKRLM